jgi:tetratricopeptide (TPR) repeat protein
MLAGITLAIYWPAGRLGFSLYDDWDYVYQNTHVQSGTLADIQWAFTTSAAGNWHPATWLSHMLDCKLFGLNAGGPHWTNLGFHVVNTLLLFMVLNEMTRAVWRSALVAALFAWHPMHIQSVAWISERKDLLSGFFMLLTLWAYARYARGRSRVESRGSKTKIAVQAPARRGWALDYGLALVFFALGLMSKPMLVTVPLILLLLDYWPLGRISDFGFRPALRSTRAKDRISDSKSASQLRILKRLLWEKLPFLALSIISSGLTLWAQQKAEFVVPGKYLPWSRRVFDSLAFFTTYLEKIFWPVHLSIFYPYPRMGLLEFICSALLPILLTVFIVRRMRSQPYLIVGWLWFLVMLIPVIGLVQVGAQSIADRYTYLPSIGLFILVAWAAADLAAVSNFRRNGVALGVSAALLACLLDTKIQLGYWKNDVTLFRRCVEITKENNFEGCYLLGNAYVESGNLDAAAGSYRAALQMAPDLEEAHDNLGNVLYQQKKFEEAKGEYLIALRLKPGDPAIGGQLASVSQMIELENKLAGLYEALKTQDTAALHAQIASIRMARNEFPEAVEHYGEALRLEPDSPEILNNLAWLLATCPEAAFRDGARAVQLAERACEISGYQQTLYIGTLAAACAEAGRFDDAISTAQKACVLAAQLGETNLLQRNQQLLELYRAHRPYRPNSK